MNDDFKKRLRAYDNAYKKLNYKQYAIRLNKDKDADIIHILDTVPDKTNYIRELIRNSSINSADYTDSQETQK